MGNLYHASDLIRGTLVRAGELPDGTSPYHPAAIKYINQVQRSILSGSSEWGIDLSKPWPWARITKSLILIPEVTAGGVDLTNGSSAATFDTPPAVSQAGNYLKVNDRATFYRIVSHTAGLGPFTLDSNYVEETITGTAFKSIKLVYDLGPNIMRLVEPFRTYINDQLNISLAHQRDEDGKIFGVALNVFRQEWPLKRVRQGVPNRFAKVTETDDKLEVQFNRFPSKEIKIDLDVIEFPLALIDSTSSIPIIPRDFRQVLEYGAATLILADKHDDRRDEAFKLTQGALKAMVEDENREQRNFNPNYGRLITRPEQMRRDRVREFF